MKEKEEDKQEDAEDGEVKNEMHNTNNKGPSMATNVGRLERPRRRESDLTAVDWIVSYRIRSSRGGSDQLTLKPPSQCQAISASFAFWQADWLPRCL